MFLTSVFFALLTSTTALVAAATLNSSTYFFKQDWGNITFTLTAAADTRDIYFRVIFPGGYDWMSIGIGGSMKDALTFIMYPAKNGTSLTWSPRLSYSHSEPVYSSQINSFLVWDEPWMNRMNAGDPNSFELSAICRNCTNWSNPPLDLTSNAAPFMWAVGPPTSGYPSRWSNSPSFPLRSHSAYATFTMNMQQATVSTNPQDTMPDIGNSTNGAGQTNDLTQSTDYTSPLHAALITIGIIILIPLNFLFRLCIKSIKFHICMVVFITIFFVIGIVLGFLLSPQFIRSKNYKSGHQILGFVVIALFALQIPLGFLSNSRLNRQRRRNRQQQSSFDANPLTPSTLNEESSTPKLSIKSRPLGLAHFSSTFLVIVLVIVDGALGWSFALSHTYNAWWSPTTIGYLFIIAVGVSLRYVYVTAVKDTKDEQMDAERYEHEQAEAIKHAQTRAFEMKNYGYAGNAQAPAGEQVYESVAVPGSYGR